MKTAVYEPEQTDDLPSFDELETASIMEAVVEEKVAEIQAAPPSEMAALIAGMKDSFIAAIHEMKKPSAEEQKKIDDERGRRLRTAEAAAYAAKVQETQSARMQAACGHSKPDGSTAFIAQVNSDGCYRPFCPICRYQSRPIRATENQKAEGLNMNKMRGITIAMWEKMANASEAPIPIMPVPIGMVADLAGI